MNQTVFLQGRHWILLLEWCVTFCSVFVSTETIKGITSLIYIIPGDLISNSDGGQRNKKAIWEEKCNFSIWESLMQSELDHSYQIAHGIKALSITHPTHIINRDSYEKAVSSTKIKGL